MNEDASLIVGRTGPFKCRISDQMRPLAYQTHSKTSSSLPLVHQPSALKLHSSSSRRKSHRERVRKWPICSKADSTNTRVRPKGRGLLPVVPSQPGKTSEDGFSLLQPQFQLSRSSLPLWLPAPLQSGFLLQFQIVGVGGGQTSQSD